MMIFVLIPIVWLALIAFVVVLCRMAARGDEALLAPAAPPACQSHPSVPAATRRVRKRRTPASGGTRRVAYSQRARLPR
jgi:hypothetical protein